LQSGGRGYKYGCLSKGLHAFHTTSASAYAAALSGSDFARQAEKIEAIVNWLGMAVNVKKCAVTGMLWGQACRNGSDKVLSSRMMKMLQQSPMVKYMTPIFLLHPYSATFAKYSNACWCSALFTTYAMSNLWQKLPLSLMTMQKITWIMLLTIFDCCLIQSKAIIHCELNSMHVA